MTTTPQADTGCVRRTTVTTQSGTQTTETGTCTKSESVSVADTEIGKIVARLNELDVSQREQDLLIQKLQSGENLTQLYFLISEIKGLTEENKEEIQKLAFDAIVEHDKIRSEISALANASLAADNALSAKIDSLEQKHDSAIQANADDIRQNAQDIAANRATIEGNSQDISANVLAIQQNTQNIASNAAGVQQNAQGIASNATAISTKANQSDLNAVQQELLTKASQGDLSALQAVVALKADKSDTLTPTQIDAAIAAGIANAQLDPGQVNLSPSIIWGLLEQDPRHETGRLIAGTIAPQQLVVINRQPLDTAAKVGETWELDVLVTNALYVSWEWDSGTGAAWSAYVGENGNPVNTPLLIQSNGGNLAAGSYKFRMLAEGQSNDVISSVATVTITA